MDKNTLNAPILTMSKIKILDKKKLKRYVFFLRKV